MEGHNYPKSTCQAFEESILRVIGIENVSNIPFRLLVRTERLKANLSAYQMACKLGIKLQDYCKFEEGKLELDHDLFDFIFILNYPRISANMKLPVKK